MLKAVFFTRVEYNASALRTNLKNKILALEVHPIPVTHQGLVLILVRIISPHALQKDCKLALGAKNLAILGI